MPRKALGFVGCLCLGTACAWTAPAAAQAPGGITVQLPTYNFFTTQTSVMVPDRGGTSLGGVSRSSGGRREFGPPFLPGNRAFGSATSGGSMEVNVVVHDLQAMDEALLGGAGAGGGGGGAQAGGALASAAPERPVFRVGGTASDAAPNSLAAIRLEKSRESAERTAAALALVADADRSAAAGQKGAARIFLKQALRQADGDLKQSILERLAALTPPPATTSAGR